MDLDAGRGLVAVAVEPGALDGFAAAFGLQEDVGVVPCFCEDESVGGRSLLGELLFSWVWVFCNLPGSASAMVRLTELGPFSDGTAVLVASGEGDGHPTNADGVVVGGEEGVGARVVGLDLGAARLRARVALVAVVDFEVEVGADLVEAADVWLRAAGIGEFAAATRGLGAVEADAEVDLVDGRVG